MLGLCAGRFRCGWPTDADPLGDVGLLSRLLRDVDLYLSVAVRQRVLPGATQRGGKARRLVERIALHRVSAQHVGPR